MKTTKYDIVIIGSGLAGLACGSILSKAGYKVCILEKHYQIGGCLQTFKRKGKLFDTGMHYIGSYGEGEILNKLFKYFGIYDKIVAKKLDKDAFDILTFGNKKFAYPQGFENFKKKLIEEFPEEINGINTYFKEINKINDSVDILNLRDITDFTLGLKHSMDVNTYSFIKSITNNSSLQNILAGLNSLYAGEQGSSPLFIHATITKFFLQSAWRLIGGGGQIANALKDEIENYGGTIKIKANVVDFILEENKITKVKLENGDEIEGTTFISSMHPAKMVDIIGTKALKKAYINRIKGLENTISTFSLYIALKEKSFKYMNANIYHYRNENVWGLSDYEVENWPGGFMLYASESKKHPGYAESIIVLSPMRFNEMAPWENTQIENRGEGYKKMKIQKAEKLLDVVEERFPDLRLSIDEYFTSTPLTYRDYTGTIEGSMYGIKHNCNNPLHSVILPKTKVKNLLMTGQNINLHGILGVSFSAILTCGEIIGINNIIRQIRDEKA